MGRLFQGFSVVVVLLLSATAMGATPRKEASDRFDRGLRLFNEGDNTGALLEFKRAYELSGEMAILLNVGLVYAELARPVDAVAALDKVLANPGGIPAKQLGRAQRVRDEQALRIGRLTVTTNVPAQIEIDNVVVGRTPMAVPIQVASGLRLLSVVAAGHLPLRQEVAIAGGQQIDIPLSLMPMQGALANLKVHCLVPGAEVLVDGKLVGRTPLPASVTLPPGTHAVGLRRPGYRSISQTIALSDGSTGEVTLEAVEDQAELDLVGGQVNLAIDPPDANVIINGIARANYRDGLRLPAGPHRLSITRAGFLPFERELSVDKDLPRTIRIVLVPTEETRGRIGKQRRNAWITMGVGVAVAGAGVYGIVKARSDQRDADAAYQEVLPLISKGGSCDATTFPLSLDEQAACQAKTDQVNGMLDDAKRLKWIGWGVAGAGGAIILTGVILRLMAEDAETTLATAPGIRPYAWSDSTGGGLGLYGQF